MSATRRRLAASALLMPLLAFCGCAASSGNEDGDGWRPFRADSPVFSSGGIFGRQPPPGYGSSLTVPRLIGKALAPAPLREEEGNVWPDPEPPRTTLTDPDAVARGVPNFQPLGLPPQLAPYEGPARSPRQDPAGKPSSQRDRPGTVIQRPDGRPAVEGAGTEGVWTYGVPGRPGVGTAFPDGRGGRILVEPGGGTVVAPR